MTKNIGQIVNGNVYNINKGCKLCGQPTAHNKDFCPRHIKNFEANNALISLGISILFLIAFLYGYYHLNKPILLAAFKKYNNLWPLSQFENAIQVINPFNSTQLNLLIFIIGVFFVVIVPILLYRKISKKLKFKIIKKD